MQSWFPMEQDSFHGTGNTFLLNCLSATLCSCFSSAATCAWKKFIFSMFINCQCEQNLSFSYNPSCIQEQCTCAHWRYNRSCKNSKWWLSRRIWACQGHLQEKMVRLNPYHITSWTLQAYHITFACCGASRRIWACQGHLQEKMVRSRRWSGANSCIPQHILELVVTISFVI